MYWNCIHYIYIYISPQPSGTNFYITRAREWYQNISLEGASPRGIYLRRARRARRARVLYENSSREARWYCVYPRSGAFWIMAILDCYNTLLAPGELKIQVNLRKIQQLQRFWQHEYYSNSFKTVFEKCNIKFYKNTAANHKLKFEF